MSNSFEKVYFLPTQCSISTNEVLNEMIRYLLSVLVKKSDFFNSTFIKMKKKLKNIERNPNFYEIQDLIFLYEFKPMANFFINV